jgi:hypothetical protein
VSKTFEEKKKEVLEKTSIEFRGVKEAIGPMQKLMENLEESGLLKSHQALPVIPDYVAQLVDYTVKVQHTIPSDIIGYFYFRNEQFPIEDMNLPSDILDLEKLSEYFKIGLHRFEFERACIIGYESQLFYLKNKLTGMYLAYDGMNDLYEVWEAKAHKFTQVEIDSMNTGSYEQIEVTE